MPDPNSPEQIQANLRGRQTAEEVMEILDSVAGDLPELARPRFWETLGGTVLQRCGYSQTNKVPTEEAPYSDEEALAFERMIVPYGKYQGEQVGEVPVSYWTYITESDFNHRLVRYLRSNHYQRRQEKETPRWRDEDEEEQE